VGDIEVGERRPTEGAGITELLVLVEKDRVGRSEVTGIGAENEPRVMRSEGGGASGGAGGGADGGFNAAREDVRSLGWNPDAGDGSLSLNWGDSGVGAAASWIRCGTGLRSDGEWRAGWLA
jgi:hypothetical protein